MLLPAPRQTSWHIHDWGDWLCRAVGRRNAQCKGNWPENILLTVGHSINNLMPYSSSATGTVAWALALEHSPPLKYLSSQYHCEFGNYFSCYSCTDRACKIKRPSLCCSVCRNAMTQNKTQIFQLPLMVPPKIRTSFALLLVCSRW